MSSSADNFLSVVANSLQEMSEVIEACERELVLYQDPEIVSLVGECYIILLRSLTRFHKVFSKLPWVVLGRMDFREDIEKSVSRIRRLSQSVQREVDYRHRSEMREASDRLVDMQVEQRKIVMAVEDQKRVLQGLQEERKIMSLVQEQQKIMQVVQDIQNRMQNSSCLDSDSNVNIQ